MIRSRTALLLFLSLLPRILPAGESVPVKTWGADVEILGYGTSLGGFVSIHPLPSYRLAAELDWTVTQNNDSFVLYDYYYNPIPVNQTHLSLVKLILDATWYPFINTMDPSFQFGLFGSLGPVLALDTANDEGFFQRWGRVEPYWTFMGRGGVHARIRTDRGGVYLLRLGTDQMRFAEALDGRTTYSGLFFQVGLEFLLP